MGSADSDKKRDGVDEQLILKWKKKIQRGFLRLIVLRLFYEQIENYEFIGYHGWALREKISQMSKNSWIPSTGSLYPVLKELNKDKLINLMDSSPSDKKIYKITKIGISLYRELEEISPLITPHRFDFNSRIPPEILQTGFREAQDHRSKQELEIMRERFTLFISILDDMIQMKQN